MAVARGWAVARDRPMLSVLGLAFALVVGILIDGLAAGRISPESVGIFLWQGVVIGLVIGLAGVGLSMTYSILGFANFAHGEYLTFGAFGGWVATYLVSGFGSFELAGLLLLGLGSSAVSAGALGVNILQTPLAVIVGALAAAVITVLLALVIDRIVYRPMRDHGGISLLIASIGVAFILRYVLVLVFGTGFVGVTTGAGADLSVPGVGLSASAGELAVIGASLVLVVGLHLLLQHTKLGVAMRAMSDNESLARVTGIPTERVVRHTWVVGAGLTGMAGYMLVLWRGSLSFDLGWNILLLVFAAVILGGIGSAYGAVLGGVIIGVSSRLSLVWLPAGFVNVAAFTVMIVVLIVRPRGLFEGSSST